MPNHLNIVFILIDDMGWMDLTCQGSPFYETPNIDKLAQRGVRFKDAYAACPVCSPTRASIMTGRYPARVGVTDWIDWTKRYHPCRGRLIDAPYIDHLPPNEVTLAAALREGGYQTWHVGKWHLGDGNFAPDQQGFDVNIGGSRYGCPKTYFAPWTLPNLPDDVPPGTFLDDHLTDNAIRLIETRDDARPFYLNLWYYLVHTPIQGKPELIDKYKAKRSAMGLEGVTEFEEGEHFPMHHKAHQRLKRRLVQSDPVYAAMIETLDTNIGRLMAALEAAGQLDNTLIVFTSDNGGQATSEGSPTTNKPLCEGKGWMYEGGTRTPLLIAWPGVTKPGSTCSTPVTSPDFYPTFLEAAGLSSRPQQHADGLSLVPLLRGGTRLDREAIYWHYPHYGNQGGTPGSSLRAGDWKLIEFYETSSLELYNLREDIGETNNLAAKEPGRVRELHAKLKAWRDRMNAVYPTPNPQWKPPTDPAAAPTV